MKKMKKVRSVLLLSSVLLFVSLTGVGCFNTPIVIPINIPIGDTIDLSDLPAGSIATGLPIPDDLSNMDVQVCDLPEISPTILNDLINEQVGGLLGGFLSGRIQLTSVVLNSLTLTASEGNFNTLSLVSTSWVPATGVPTNLGTAVEDPAGAGLGTEIVLATDSPPYLLALLQTASEEGGCASLQFHVAGTIPNSWPTFGAEVAATVTLNVKGIIMPMIVNNLLENLDSLLEDALS